jgi:FAD synthetase
MTSASLPPQAPMTNGIHKMVNGEADVSSPAHPATHSLEDVCALLHEQVGAFLSAAPENDVTKRTQEQTRISMQVIEKALNDYELSEPLSPLRSSRRKSDST